MNDTQTNPEDNTKDQKEVKFWAYVSHLNAGVDKLSNEELYAILLLYQHSQNIYLFILWRFFGIDQYMFDRMRNKIRKFTQPFREAAKDLNDERPD